jgi:hypothetical protein
MQASFSTRQVNRRFRGILGALKTGQTRPTAEIVRELAELSQALEDAPAKPDVIARLTLTRADGIRFMYEMHSTATYASFYHVYTQRGSRRSTKVHVRTAGRVEGQNLEEIVVRWKARESKSNPLTDIKIRIYRRREYRRLISARPDELGLVKCPPSPLPLLAFPGRS